MKDQTVNQYLCPVDYEAFDLRMIKSEDSNVSEGELVCSLGHKYPIIDGVAKLVDTDTLASEDIQSKEQYDQMVQIYDTGAEWLFKSF